MKKPILLILSLVILSSFVFAGTKHDLDLSSGKETISANERDIIEFKYWVREYEEPAFVGDKEVIKFTWRETTQRIMVDKVTTSRVDITNFIEGSDVPYYVQLNKAVSLNLDFERDDITDVAISLVSIDNKTVTLQFQDLVGGGSPNAEGVDKEEVEEVVEEEIIPITEEEPVEENVPILEEGSTELPYYVTLLANNWEITAVIALILLILIWNKRSIKRWFRRTF